MTDCFIVFRCCLETLPFGFNDSDGSCWRIPARTIELVDGSIVETPALTIIRASENIIAEVIQMDNYFGCATKNNDCVLPDYVDFGLTTGSGDNLIRVVRGDGCENIKEPEIEV